MYNSVQIRDDFRSPERRRWQSGSRWTQQGADCTRRGGKTFGRENDDAGGFSDQPDVMGKAGYEVTVAQEVNLLIDDEELALL